VLFAIYIDDVCTRTCSRFYGHSYVILYADDILLLAPSVTILESIHFLCTSTWLLIQRNPVAYV